MHMLKSCIILVALVAPNNTVCSFQSVVRANVVNPGPVVLLFSKFHKTQKITFLKQGFSFSVNFLRLNLPALDEVGNPFENICNLTKNRFGGEQISVVVMELHCGEVVMRTVTLCHQLSPQCIP